MGVLETVLISLAAITIASLCIGFCKGFYKAWRADPDPPTWKEIKLLLHHRKRLR